jgi:hypothetical protein
MRKFLLSNIIMDFVSSSHSILLVEFFDSPARFRLFPPGEILEPADTLVNTYCFLFLSLSSLRKLVDEIEKLTEKFVFQYQLRRNSIIAHSSVVVVAVLL